jgi:hypothetical protein
MVRNLKKSNFFKINIFCAEILDEPNRRQVNESPAEMIVAPARPKTTTILRRD